MKIVKISSNVGRWFDLPTPVDIKTPLGKQRVSKFYYNGFHETFLVNFVNGDGKTYSIRATGNHKFRNTNGIFIRTDELVAGEIMDSGWVFIKKDIIEEPTPTMDMEVPNEHCYILECGIVSHNTSLIMGGVSEGINPDVGMVFNQSYSGGEVKRVTPVFLDLLKRKGLYNDDVISRIKNSSGSIQHMDEFTVEEKSLYRTAFEYDQRVILRLAAQRQQHTDQAQSINLFFSGNASPKYVSDVHKEAFKNEYIHSLYYIYSTTGAYEQEGACTSCQ